MIPIQSKVLPEFAEWLEAMFGEGHGIGHIVAEALHREDDMLSGENYAGINVFHALLVNGIIQHHLHFIRDMGVGVKKADELMAEINNPNGYTGGDENIAMVVADIIQVIYSTSSYQKLYGIVENLISIFMEHGYVRGYFRAMDTTGSTKSKRHMDTYTVTRSTQPSFHVEVHTKFDVTKHYDAIKNVEGVSDAVQPSKYNILITVADLFDDAEVITNIIRYISEHIGDANSHEPTIHDVPTGELGNMLADAVNIEDFVTAAMVRDEINRRKQQTA